MNSQPHTTCIRCIVSGRVQGVFFRHSTRQRALGLGIRGHARNLSDGSVEVLACGSEQALEQLRAWLWEGPPTAQVTRVECKPVENPQPGGFTTA
jgi:acylphosphatase